MYMLLRVSPDQHIIAGKVSQYGDHPYACSLHRRSQGRWSFICGAAILDEYNVITAAHCVSGGSAGDFRVRCGDFHLVNLDEFEQTKSIAAIKTHERYYGKPSYGYPNDIALLKVASPLRFNRYVNTLRIAQRGDRVPVQCQLIGWGKTGD
ncbi:hypothetical protein ACOMHN_035557 [Nucella lapillus]